MHGIFDVNNDGVISFDDFNILAEKFGDLGHLSNEEMEEFRAVMRVCLKNELKIFHLIGVFNYDVVYMKKKCCKLIDSYSRK